MSGKERDGAASGLEGARRLVAWLSSPYLLLTLAAFFWSANMVVGRAARDLIPPIAFNFWRWALALLILLPFTGRDLVRQRALVLREWRIPGVLALTGITVFHSVIYLGLSRRRSTACSCSRPRPCSSSFWPG